MAVGRGRWARGEASWGSSAGASGHVGSRSWQAAGRTQRSLRGPALADADGSLAGGRPLTPARAHTHTHTCTRAAHLMAQTRLVTLGKWKPRAWAQLAGTAHLRGHAAASAQAPARPATRAGASRQNRRTRDIYSSEPTDLFCARFLGNRRGEALLIWFKVSCGSQLMSTSFWLAVPVSTFWTGLLRFLDSRS